MYSAFLSAALVFAWFITPEALVLLGRGTGQNGMWQIIFLLCGSTLACLSAMCIYHSSVIVKYSSDYGMLRAVIGDNKAMSLLLACRLPILFFGSTGLLVSAGFAFNEIFLYWFPNFLFAFMLLTAVTLINCFSEHIALAFQSVFTGLAILGLLVLIAFGFLHQETYSGAGYHDSSDLHLSMAATGILAYLGFDFYRPKNGGKSVVIMLIFAFFLLAGWAAIQLKFVGPDLLAQSSISHLIVARGAAGEMGHYIMGGIIIMSVLAAVNGFFIILRRLFTDLAKDDLMPKFFQRGWCLSIILATIIETMMMTGVAGEEVLESQIFASLLLWLFYIGCRTVAAAQLIKERDALWARAGFLTGAVVFVILGLLSLTNQDVVYIASFMFFALSGAYLFTLIWHKLYDYYFLNP